MRIGDELLGVHHLFAEFAVRLPISFRFFVSHPSSSNAKITFKSILIFPPNIKTIYTCIITISNETEEFKPESNVKA